ncbi:hypothetical protein KKE87_04100 [Patescibacteria group bacterium]|nr:hypothetical protein [Patescibacteria group bacterium]
MPEKLPKYKKQRREKRLLIIVISLLAVFFLAAMLRIGIGKAEWAGMTVSDLTSNLAIEFSIPPDEEGVVINWVEGQAFYSGVKSGDLLKKINNEKVRNVKEFLRIARYLDINDGILLDILREGSPVYVTLYNKLGLHEKIKQALNMDSYAVPAAGNNTAMTKVGFQIPFMKGILSAPNPLAGKLPTPKEQMASKKVLVEGHWLGMELIPLTPELAKEYSIPADTRGLLVDEISLESAESGILAGDMLLAVEGVSTPDIYAFTNATRLVKNRREAEMLVSRRGQLLKFKMSSELTLGFSQNESAQPILPGAISPHKNMGQPCTACHIIMNTGGQLAIDAGDILPNPPPIIKGAKAPHRNRGVCKSCHVILRR